MSRFLFVTWDGGGNQLPARRIAAELDTRGHQTRWLMLPRKAIDMATVSPAERGAITLGQIMANPAHLAELRADLDCSPADVLVIDCLLFGALSAAQLLGVPTACLVHTVPGAFGHQPPPRVGHLAELRRTGADLPGCGVDPAPAQRVQERCRPWGERAGRQRGQRGDRAEQPDVPGLCQHLLPAPGRLVAGDGPAGHRGWRHPDAPDGHRGAYPAGHRVE